MPRQNEGTGRSGLYVVQPEGYKAFIPKPLPPVPPIMIDNELADLLSKANRALGRLDGSTETLPNPDLFVTMYVRKEAILSSQIEGTQASLDDVLAYEAIFRRRKLDLHIYEVVNHVLAMRAGIEKLNTLPVGSQLIKELHFILLKGVRGKEKLPGHFRRVQNWIGPPGYDLLTATFVPPTAPMVERSMSDLENYLRADKATPLLIKCGLAHAQFETIHPFLDGNGRLGRLLVTLILCEAEVMSRPLLYISAYFKAHRQEYYDCLQKVRDTGDFERWLKFFLRAIWQVSEEAFGIARQILAMQEEHRQLILGKVRSSANGLKLLDRLFQEPVIDVADAAQLLHISYPAANSLVTDLQRMGLLREFTGQRRNRHFIYEPYVDLLRRGTEPMPAT